MMEQENVHPVVEQFWVPDGANPRQRDFVYSHSSHPYASYQQVLSDGSLMGYYLLPGEIFRTKEEALWAEIVDLRNAIQGAEQAIDRYKKAIDEIEALSRGTSN